MQVVDGEVTFTEHLPVALGKMTNFLGVLTPYQIVGSENARDLASLLLSVLGSASSDCTS